LKPFENDERESAVYSLLLSQP